MPVDQMFGSKRAAVCRSSMLRPCFRWVAALGASSSARAVVLEPSGSLCLCSRCFGLFTKEWRCVSGMMTRASLWPCWRQGGGARSARRAPCLPRGACSMPPRTGGVSGEGGGRHATGGGTASTLRAASSAVGGGAVGACGSGGGSSLTMATCTTVCCQGHTCTARHCADEQLF